MKCFERLVLHHLKTCLPQNFDQHQFAYRRNRSTADAVTTVLHAAANHGEGLGSYVRMLFVDYSSAFNTILPSILIRKLTDLDFPPLICEWINSFLRERPQTVRVGPHLSSTRTLSTGSPQGCVLSPFLYTLYTHDCVPSDDSTILVKFADDTVVVGLISEGNEAAYREEVQRLAAWSTENNLHLNANKTKEMVLDWRRNRADPVPLQINGVCVERVSSFRYLGVHVADDLRWHTNTTAVVGKAQQRLYFLRLLKKCHLNVNLLKTFYRSTVESVLTYCITVWYASCTAKDKRRLQGVIKSAQNIIGCPLPSLEDIANSRGLKRARNITLDPSHPGRCLFNLLPSGRRYRVLRSRTNRLRDTFYPWAIRLLNT